jgi:signal transduction histidine kinase
VVLRLAIGLSQILDKYWSNFLYVIGVFLLFTVFAFFLASRMSRRLRYDIAQINGYLEQIARKNYKAELKPKYYAEFLQLSIRLKHLVKRLKQREKQRRKYTAKLRLINQQRSDILSAISHEFKNPVAAIVGYAETLRDDPDIDPEIRRRFLEKVLSNARRITTMLDRLSFSVKLENNDLQLHRERFDLAEMCRDIVSTLAKRFPEREIVCEAEPAPVEADRTMMEIVLTNLIDNALKYSEERVQVRLEGGRVSVTDHGMGIPKKELENITSKYYRVVRNTWDNSMGLGLSIVSYILKLHDTKLRIESEVGVGSTFSFAIPLDKR